MSEIYGYQPDGSYIDPNSGKKYTPEQIYSGMRSGTFDPDYAAAAANERWVRENPQEVERIVRQSVAANPNYFSDVKSKYESERQALEQRRLSLEQRNVYLEQRASQLERNRELINQYDESQVNSFNKQLSEIKEDVSSHKSDVLKYSVSSETYNKKINAFNEVLGTVNPKYYTTPARFYKEGTTKIPESQVDRRIMGFIPNPIEKQDIAASEFITKNIGISNYGQFKYLMENAVVPVMERSTMPLYGVGYGVVSSFIEKPISEPAISFAAYGIGKVIEAAGIGISSAAKSGKITEKTAERIFKVGKYSEIGIGAVSTGLAGYSIATSPQPTVESGRILADVSMIGVGGYMVSKTPNLYDIHESSLKVNPLYKDGRLNDYGGLGLKQEIKPPKQEIDYGKLFSSAIDTQRKNAGLSPLLESEKPIYTKTGSVVSEISARNIIKSGQLETISDVSIPKVIDLTPEVDLTRVSILKANFLSKPAPTTTLTQAERAMVVRQYGLSETEIVAAKKFGLSLNDILAVRTRLEVPPTFEKPVFEVKTAINKQNVYSTQVLQKNTRLRSMRIQYQEPISKQKESTIAVISTLSGLSGLKTQSVEKYVENIEYKKQVALLTGLSLKPVGLKTTTQGKTPVFPITTTTTSMGGVYNPLPKTPVFDFPKIPGFKMIVPPATVPFLPKLEGYRRSRPKRKTRFYWFKETTPVWTPKIAAFGSLNIRKKSTVGKKR
jgi:hypothetical protein